MLNREVTFKVLPFKIFCALCTIKANEQNKLENKNIHNKETGGFHLALSYGQIWQCPQAQLKVSFREWQVNLYHRNVPF